MSRTVTDWRAEEIVVIADKLTSVTCGRLMTLVFEACDREGWQKAPQAGVASTVMRSVIVYCMALNICGSDEILEKAGSDDAVSYLCSNRLLDWQQIHEFRRRNARAIEDSLAVLFSRLGNLHNDPICLREARSRLRRAIQADSIVLDL